ncbi:MAG: immunoglobulin domain-containing protein [Methanotrichaceae archaeon]|nr:immunoglobulin domain-containing protein [Methanotrichaceae archaeon]
MSNSCGSSTSEAASLTVNTLPAIVAHPVSLTKCLGEQATFSVTATGSEPLSYQWKKDGQDINEANTATYTIDSVTSSDSGDYNVIVSNDCGSVRSDIAVEFCFLSWNFCLQFQ